MLLVTICTSVQSNRLARGNDIAGFLERGCIGDVFTAATSADFVTIALPDIHNSSKGKPMATGVCKLTGRTGAFIKAHIIPRALTFKQNPSGFFVQGGLGMRPIRRWDSWYDSTLVTREGEDILERHDSRALEELRKHKMVWHSWGPMVELSITDHVRMGGSFLGVRKIEQVDALALRLFFLSVFWRTAASTLSDFKNITISTSQMRRLRRMVRDSSPYPLAEFPVVLTQISTIGPRHNYGPVADRRPAWPDRRNGPTLPFFRFFMDGLIAHIYPDRSSLDTAELGPFVLGGKADKVVITTVTLEGSRLQHDLDFLIPASYVQYPEVMKKLWPNEPRLPTQPLLIQKPTEDIEKR